MPARDPRLTSFGEAIRATRESLGWSQEELAHAAALHRTYVGSIERGERNLSFQNMYAIADALSVPLVTLLPE